MTSLAAHGWRVTPIVRRQPGAGEIGWDPHTGRLNPEDLAGVDGVVHLAGENIGARWTTARKRRIRESRVRGTSLLSETLARLHTLAQRYVRMHLQPAGRVKRAIKEHTALHEAWAAQDAKEARRLCQAHIDETLEELSDALSPKLKK